MVTPRQARQLLHGTYRIVFRGGSPQRIPYSDALYVSSLLASVGAAAIAHWLTLDAGPIAVGALLFTGLSGIYLATALLTRKVPRVRLQPSLLAIWLVLLAAALLLMAGALPVRLLGLDWLRGWFGAGAAAMVLAGATNVLRYAIGVPTGPALALVVLVAGSLVAFYLTLTALLAVVFA